MNGSVNFPPVLSRSHLAVHLSYSAIFCFRRSEDSLNLNKKLQIRTVNVTYRTHFNLERRKVSSHCCPLCAICGIMSDSAVRYTALLRAGGAHISGAALSLSLLMSYIYGAPCKARNFNVVHIWTYVWQR
jgi:hypothetical protein